MSAVIAAFHGPEESIHLVQRLKRVYTVRQAKLMAHALDAYVSFPLVRGKLPFTRHGVPNLGMRARDR